MHVCVGQEDIEGGKGRGEIGGKILQYTSFSSVYRDLCLFLSISISTPVSISNPFSTCVYHMTKVYKYMYINTHGNSGM